MVKPKFNSKNTQKRGVDFKKIKRKVGRKLPPPKNATNTEIASKAIVLLEQSIASERAGLAVSKKGLTLKELLQQTNHHNAKVRKDALTGIREILLKTPAELKLHKLAVIEKLRERIADDDKLVRETLYQLFKSVVFPGCVKDDQGSSVSQTMQYIFSAMTHFAIDVQLMAFKFLDLVLHFYPPSFSLYAEKILQNYQDILWKNQLLGDKSKLKSILAGLIRCLTLLPCIASDNSANQNDFPAQDALHAFESEDATKTTIGPTDIAKQMKNLLHILVVCFLNFMPLVNDGAQLDLQSCDCMHCTLQIIDLIVRFLVTGICGSDQDPNPHEVAYDLLFKTLKRLWDVFPLNIVHHLSGKVGDRVFMSNTVITKIFLQFSYWDNSVSALLEKFLEFIEMSLTRECFYLVKLLKLNISNDAMHIGSQRKRPLCIITRMQQDGVFHEKLLLPLIPCIPKLTTQISIDWRSRILRAFTEVFKNSNPQSLVTLACLSAIAEMLVPETRLLHLDSNDPTLLDYQIDWLHRFPSLLTLLDNKNPLCSKDVLHLQLRVGQVTPVNSTFFWAFHNLLHRFGDFFSLQLDNSISYGPFSRLPADIQELAICCLYYFPYMDAKLLQSVALCCLCEDLQPALVLRMLEVLQSAFAVGHIQIGDYTSLHITLLSRFHVYHDKPGPLQEHDLKSNWRTFKNITSVVCSHLSAIGDDHLVFDMLEKIIIDQMCGEIAVENKCALLRLLITLDSVPTRVSNQSIDKISDVLARYLIDVYNVGENDHESASPNGVKRLQYYLLPTFHLFFGSKRILYHVLKVMGALVSEDSSLPLSHPLVNRSTTINSITSLLLHMYKDVKMRQMLMSCKADLETMLQNLHLLLASESSNLTLEERHKIQRAYDRLRAVTNNEVKQPS